VGQQDQALRLIARSFVGLAVSCALVLQLLLVAFATGSLAASSTDDPFTICYGSGDGGAPGHAPDGTPVNPLHCLLACAQAHGGGTATLPLATVLQLAPAAIELGPRVVAVIPSTKRGFAHSSRGPPTSA
jgi:hypothetical protein